MSMFSNKEETPSGSDPTMAIIMGVPDVGSLRASHYANLSAAKQASHFVDAPQAVMLPILATANDVREVVQYLKKRPEGVNISEVVQPIKKRIFYPPKVEAYEAWGIVTRTRGRIRLTSIGWEFARCLEPEARSYRMLLNSTDMYRAALNWIQQQSLDVVTEDEIADYWQAHFPATLDQDGRKRAEASAVCFFHLCQAAELGTRTIGKRGQPARLRLLRDEIQDFLQSDLTDTQSAEIRASEAYLDPVQGPQGHSLSSVQRNIAEPTRALRVCISCYKRGRVVDQIQQMLILGDVSCEIADRSTSGAAPFSRDAGDPESGCQAGIIVITEEDLNKDQEKTGLLTNNVLSEIGWAFVHYEGRILLSWDQAIPVPDNLQSLRRCGFKDGALTWDSGVELIKAVKDFAADYHAFINR